MRDLSIKILPRAKLDLDEIWTKIAKVDFDRADRFVAKLESRISSLTHFPESGVDRSEVFPNIKLLVDGNYLIFYKFELNKILVMRVVHGARDLNELEFI